MMFKRTLICDGALETIVKWEGCGLDFAARSREHFVKQRFAGLYARRHLLDVLLGRCRGRH